MKLFFLLDIIFLYLFKSNNCLNVCQDQFNDSSPPVRNKHIVGVTQPVAPRKRAVRKFLFTHFPRERRSVHRTLLLTFGGDGAASGTPMRRIFARHVTLPITTCHRTPAEIDKFTILFPIPTVKWTFKVISLWSVVRTTTDPFLGHQNTHRCRRTPVPLELNPPFVCTQLFFKLNTAVNLSFELVSKHHPHLWEHKWAHIRFLRKPTAKIPPPMPSLDVFSNTIMKINPAQWWLKCIQTREKSSFVESTFGSAPINNYGRG